MRHFTTTEAQCDFALVTTFQKARQVLKLDLIIAFIGARTEFNFLNLDLLLLLLLSRFLLLGLKTNLP